MASFAVISDAVNPAVDEAITAQFAESNRLKLNDRVWLISSDKLVRTIADEIGISDGKRGRVVVFGLTPAFWGYHGKDTWEWLSLKAKQ